LILGTGDLALKVEALDPGAWADGRSRRSNYFTILWARGDAIMMGAGLITMADSAKAYLRHRPGRTAPAPTSRQGAVLGAAV
jgi:hypothetical protein